MPADPLVFNTNTLTQMQIDSHHDDIDVAGENGQNKFEGSEKSQPFTRSCQFLLIKMPV